MSTSEPTDLSQLITSVDSVPGYWLIDIFWAPLVTRSQTKSQYSVIEQLMAAPAGPPPHVHDHSDELIYILEGEMTMQLEEQLVNATAGQLVRIPAGVAHGFVVSTDTARVLNFYAPAEFDLTIATLGTPATSPTVPPPGVQQGATREQHEALARKLFELEVNSPTSTPDLLDQYRRGDYEEGRRQLMGK